MEELYKLKKMLCKELEQYGDKKDLSAGSLEVVDKLAHSIKNICKIIEMYDEGDYSNRAYNSYDDGNNSMAPYDRRYSREGSYANRRQHYVRGHYSRADGLVDQLRDMEDEAPNSHIRQEIHKLVEKMEQM